MKNRKKEKAMNVCQKCDKNFDEEYNFCPVCGRAFENDNNPEYWRAKARGLRIKGKIRSSIECNNKFTELTGGDAYSFKALGELYYQMGEINQSIENFMKSIEKKNDFPDTY